MEIKIKRWHLISLFVILFVIVMYNVMAQFGLFGTDVAWHPLQQVATDNTGTLSVDVNGDGVVDDAGGVLNGACRLCNSCGGNYNVEIGNFADSGVNSFSMQIFDNSCGLPSGTSNLSTETGIIYFCCRT